MSVVATFGMDMNVRETLSQGVDGSASPVVSFTELNVGATLKSTTTPPVTTNYQDTIALVAGAYTLDLTNLIGAGGGVRDCTGLKVQLLRVSNRGTASLTFTKGASNGYALWSTTHTVTLPAYSGTGEYPTAMFFLPEGTPDVASGAKTIDFAGTGTNQFDISLAAG